MNDELEVMAWFTAAPAGVILGAVCWLPADALFGVGLSGVVDGDELILSCADSIL
jgi:hypothetical protein